MNPMNTVTYHPRNVHELETPFGPQQLEVGHATDQVVVNLTPEAGRVLARVVATSPAAVGGGNLAQVLTDLVVDLLASAALADLPTGVDATRAPVLRLAGGRS